MRCFVELDITADIIEIPDELGPKIKKYRNQFLDWLYDKKNRHKYSVKRENGNGGFFEGVCFDTEAFVEWLNKKIKGNYAPVTFVERGVNPENCPEGMLRIFF